MGDLKKIETDQLLFKDISKLIDEARKKIACTVNGTLALLYWQIGKRINKEILQNKRGNTKTNYRIVNTTIRRDLWKRL